MVISSYDGKSVFVGEWISVPDPIGIVHVVHGLKDSGKRYAELSAALNKNGYLVVCPDLRAHGETDASTHGYCEGDVVKDTLRDMAAVAVYYKKRYPNLRYVLLGCSYGSILAQLFISGYSRLVDACVLCGSRYVSRVDALRRYISVSASVKLKGEMFPNEKADKKLLSPFAKKFSDGEWQVEYSNDEALGEEASALANDGAGDKFVCSNNLLKSLYKNVLSLYDSAYVAQLKADMPLLILSGERDAVGDFGKSVKKLYAFYVKSGMRKVELQFVKRTRNRLFDERTSRDFAIDIIIEFLRKY